jgi:hypothetical protein
MLTYCAKTQTPQEKQFLLDAKKDKYLLLLLLTLQPFVCFGLLHQFIQGFPLFDETWPVLHF